MGDATSGSSTTAEIRSSTGAPHDMRRQPATASETVSEPRWGWSTTGRAVTNRHQPEGPEMLQPL